MLLPVGIENKILFVWFSTRSGLAEIGRGNHFHLCSAAKSRTKLISGLFFTLNEPHSRQVEEEIQGHTGGQILLTVWNIRQCLMLCIINSLNMESSPPKERVLAKRKLKLREFRWPKITQLGNHIEFGLINTRLFLCPHLGQTIQPLLLEKGPIFIYHHRRTFSFHTPLWVSSPKTGLYKTPAFPWQLPLLSSILIAYFILFECLKAVLPTGWNSWLQQVSRSGKTHLSPERSAVPTELRNHRQEPSGLGKMAGKWMILQTSSPSG